MPRSSVPNIHDWMYCLCCICCCKFCEIKATEEQQAYREANIKWVYEYIRRENRMKENKQISIHVMPINKSPMDKQCMDPAPSYEEVVSIK